MTPGTSSDAMIDPSTVHPTAETRAAGKILVCLPPSSGEALAGFAEGIRTAFPDDGVAVAGADEAALGAGIPVVAYTTPRSDLGWVLAAADYSAAATAAGEQEYTGAIVIGTETVAHQPELLQGMVAALGAGGDLVVPRFASGSHEGLVNSALLYPLSRALFGPDIRYPLPVVAALSQRMLRRLAPIAQRLSGESLIWPVAEAVAAGFTVREVGTGMQGPPRPAEDDLSKLLTGVASSLFLDVEAKASFWQRARVLNRTAAAPALAFAGRESAGTDAEIEDIVANFRLAYANLLEIWSLVLPPQTLVALKRLSQATPATFFLPAELWARIVYEFALAFHLRSLNRGHLLGALTPLYLAWVASHVRAAGDDDAIAAQLIEITAAAFEREKPYLVARWRWPDRFNP